MLEFNIKLRSDSKKISISNLNSDSLKLKFKVKGLYKDKFFSGEVYLIVKLENNKLNIIDLSINDLDVKKCNSSYDDIFTNIYTLTAFDLIDNENITKKVYNSLKTFINGVKITSDKNLITSIIFDSTNSKFRKLNIKGYVRKH